jgi:hypothetical protein
MLHLAHQKPVPWNLLFGYMAAVLGVKLVPYANWLLRLTASETETTVRQNPALRLLDFYTSVETDGEEADQR